MPLNPAKVGQAVSGGLSIVCATCDRYWEGRDKRLPEPQCTSQVACGSPLSGDTFSQYAGPMTNFEEWCFRCGCRSDLLVSLGGRGRRLGVCREHASMFNELKATSGSSSANPLLSREGQIIRPQDLLPRKSPIKTLSALIKESDDNE